MNGAKLSASTLDAALDVSRRTSSLEKQNGSSDWTLDRAAQRYQIQGWGAPYYHVNARGQIDVTPDPERGQSINLYDLAEELRARGLNLPLLIRFPDIVGHRIKRINEAFAKAIAEYDYQGTYRGVFPVKVNQQRHLVEEIVEVGRK